MTDLRGINLFWEGQYSRPRFKWCRRNEKSYLLSADNEESECMPVWFEEGVPMLPAIWFIWLEPGKNTEEFMKNWHRSNYTQTSKLAFRFIPYLMGSYFASAGVGGPVGFAEMDPGPAPEQETGSHMAGPGLHRPSAWSWGQFVLQRCWWLLHWAGQVQLHSWHFVDWLQMNLA